MSVRSRIGVTLADGFTDASTFLLDGPLDKLDLLVRDGDALAEFLVAGTWRDGLELPRGIGVSRPGLSELYQHERGIRGIRFRNRTAGEAATLTFLDLYTAE